MVNIKSKVPNIPKEKNSNQETENKEKISDKQIIKIILSEVRFDIIGDKIIKKVPLFVMDDNEDFFIYEGGVYKAQKTVNLDLKQMIRDEYRLYFNIKNKVEFPDKIIMSIPSPSSGFIHETIEYIKSYKHVSRQKIDNEQHKYINFNNGLFNLETWMFIPHTPEIRSIAQVDTNYDPNAKCPKILKYLEDCELKDHSLNVLIEFAGYCLTTDVKMQRSLLLYGVGSNGKSVFINLLRKILGNGLVSNESLHQLEEDRFRVANLYGKTLNAFPDLKDNPLQTNDVFKRLTGNDMMTGERKGQQSFDFINTAKLLFAANKPPSIGEMGGYAFYRRWMLIEFKHKFEDDEIDKYIIDKLSIEEEKSGFVNLMLEGLKRIFENGDFSYKYTVEETQLMYECQSNNVKVFNDLCLGDCDNLGEEPTEKKELYGYYKTWCEINNLVPVSSTMFTQKLKKLGRYLKDTTKSENGERYKFYYYEDTCLREFVDLNGNELDLNEVIDGTKEKFEDKLSTDKKCKSCQDPYPELSDDIKLIL